MSKRRESPRVLVALDVSSPGRAALEAASRLAAELRAELHGLFVEDVNLLHLAGLPFAREIDSSSATLRALDVGAMEQSMQRMAEHVRRAVAEAAQRGRLQWSFRVCRGNVCRTLLAESVTADLLVVGRESTLPGLSRAQATGESVVVICETPKDSRTVETAQRLAELYSASLVILATGEVAPEEGEPLGQVQSCPTETEPLIRTLRQCKPRLVLIEAGHSLVSEALLSLLVSRLPCPIALAR